MSESSKGVIVLRRIDPHDLNGNWFCPWNETEIPDGYTNTIYLTKKEFKKRYPELQNRGENEKEI